MHRSINYTPKSGTSLTFRGNKSRQQVLKMSTANVNRLAGGADSPEAADDENEEKESKSDVKTSSDMKVKSEAGSTSVDVKEEPSNAGVSTGSTVQKEEEDEQVRKIPSLEAVLTGDKKIDDLIEYVQKNLREACEALVGMGDNIEHEIKLMFVDVIARIRRWVNSTEDKLEKTLLETRNLQIEFKTKLDSLSSCENDMEALRTQLAAAEAAAATAGHGHKKHKEHHKGDHKGDDAKSGNEEAPEVKSEDLTPSGRRRTTSEDVPQDSMSSDSRAVSRASSRVDTRMQRESAEHAQSQREAELQKEVECLRKENGRLIKERTEYENAVQRAILKGVSSLNVEALKVMRNPPATCYDPCGQQSSSLIEPMVPCGPRMSDNYPRSNMSNCSETQPRKSQGKKTCTNTNCPSAKNRKRSLAQSLLLLNERNAHC